MEPMGHWEEQLGVEVRSAGEEKGRLASGTLISAAVSWSHGRHGLTCAFFTLHFTPGRGGTHLISQMDPHPPTP